MLAFVPRAPTAAFAIACPVMSPASALVLDHTGTACVARRCTHGWAAGCNSAGTARTPTPISSAAALREATEESGIDGLTIDAELAALHVHPVTCSLGVPTRHLDMQFVARAPRDAAIACSDESLDLRWWPLDALPDDCDFGLTQLAAAARSRQTSVE